MKILMTGFTSLQCKHPKDRGGSHHIKKLDVPYMIYETLVAQGHDVDWYPVVLGQDLSGYDLAWVNLAPGTSLNARRGTLGAGYTLASDLPQVRFYDDWQMHTVISAGKSLANGPHRFYRVLQGTPLYACWEHSDTDLIRAWESVICDGLYSLSWDGHVENDSHRYVVPKFGYWGDEDLIVRQMPASHVYPIDPTPLTKSQVPDLGSWELADTPKAREWALASIMPHLDWVEKLDLTWPVAGFGTKKYKWQRLKTENDVLRENAKRWGVLSPAYRHAGSGWFRARYLYAASAGCVVYADPEDVKGLGDAYVYDLGELQAENDTALRERAAAQREQMLAATWRKSEWENAIATIVSF